MTGNEFGGQICWQYDLEQYVGKTIYLKYEGELSGYLTRFSISLFNK
jgi:hypothetical protein